MRHSTIEQEVGQVIPSAAYSYSDAEEEGYTLAYSNRSIFGAAEVYSTVGDLAKWLGNFQTPELGGQTVQQRMREPYVLTSGESTNYGLGVRVDDRRGLDRVQHSGSHAGYRTQITYFPTLEAGVVVMANYADLGATSKARAIAKIVFGKHMAPAETWEETNTDSVSVARTVLARYEGNYKSGGGEIYPIERRKDTLFFDGDRRLIPLSDTLFQIVGSKDRLSFRVGSKEKVEMAHLHDSPADVVSLRPLDLWEPSPDDLEAFRGRYCSPELETIYTFRVEDGKLVGHHRWHGELRFRPLKEAAFEAEVGPEMRIQFQRNESGAVTGFDATLGRTSSVPFRKEE